MAGLMKLKNFSCFLCLRFGQVVGVERREQGHGRGILCECSSWAHWGNSRRRQSSVLLFCLCVLKEPSLTLCCCLCPLRGPLWFFIDRLFSYHWKSMVLDSQGEIEGGDRTLSYLSFYAHWRYNFTRFAIVSVSGRLLFVRQRSLFCLSPGKEVGDFICTASRLSNMINDWSQIPWSSLQIISRFVFFVDSCLLCPCTHLKECAISPCIQHPVHQNKGANNLLCWITFGAHKPKRWKVARRGALESCREEQPI